MLYKKSRPPLGRAALRAQAEHQSSSSLSSVRARAEHGKSLTKARRARPLGGLGLTTMMYLCGVSWVDDR